MHQGEFLFCQGPFEVLFLSFQVSCQKNVTSVTEGCNGLDFNEIRVINRMNICHAFATETVVRPAFLCRFFLMS